MSQDGRRWRTIHADSGAATVAQFLNETATGTHPPFALPPQTLLTGLYFDQTHGLLSVYTVESSATGNASTSVAVQNLTRHDFLGFRNDWHHIGYRNGSLTLGSALVADQRNTAYAVSGLNKGRSFNFTTQNLNLTGIDAWKLVDGNPLNGGRFDDILLFKKLYLREMPGRISAMPPPGGSGGFGGGVGSGVGDGSGGGGTGIPTSVPEPTALIALLLLPALLHRRRRSR